MYNPSIESRFTSHKPTGHKLDKYAEIREKGKEMAYLIEKLCPACREKALAMTKIEEAVMWANAGIARTLEVCDI